MYVQGVLDSKGREMFAKTRQEDDIRYRGVFSYRGIKVFGLVFYFFINYNPKNFSPKGLRFFRWCAIIPVVYMLTSVVLYGLHNLGVIHLSVAGLAALMC